MSDKLDDVSLNAPTEQIKDKTIENDFEEQDSLEKDLAKDEDQDENTSLKDVEKADETPTKTQESNGTEEPHETSKGKENLVKEKGAADEEEDNTSAPPLPTRKSPSPEENPMLKQLKDAFPTIDEKYVKAVLIASQGQLDPAFSALLFLSDPNYEKEASLPTRPFDASIRKPANPNRKLTQLEQDELLARQLDEKYNKHGTASAERQARERRIRHRDREFERRYGSADNRRRQDEANEDYDEESDSFSTFVDKELPQIRDNLNRNIQETGKKITTWFNGIKKSLIEDEEDNYNEGNQRYSSSRFNSFGDRYGEETPDTPTKLQNAGISLHNDDLDFGSDEEIPPQLPSRAKKVVAESTYIDTPEQVRKRRSDSPLKTVLPIPNPKSPSKQPIAEPQAQKPAAPDSILAQRESSDVDLA